MTEPGSRRILRLRATGRRGKRGVIENDLGRAAGTDSRPYRATVVDRDRFTAELTARRDAMDDVGKASAVMG
ncbi:hypothetical protein WME98_18735 [Sorangium sp. So ce296]|uniref:hypothetical protein n=1 Tax=Sorangium sp. So ce296 TaxID=3133296 RepID=UPI003F63B28B